MDKPKLVITSTDDKGKPVALASAKRIEAAGPAGVVLQPSIPFNKGQQALWSAIRTRSRWMAFPVFEAVVSQLGDCGEPKKLKKGSSEEALAVMAKYKLRTKDARETCFHGIDAYNLLKATAEGFLALLCSPADVFQTDYISLAKTPTAGDVGLQEIGGPMQNEESNRNPEIDWVKFKEFLSPASYPYLEIIKAALLKVVSSPLCDGLRGCFCPIELIWSYWHEEGMLVQSLNAICLRFQNKRGPQAHDPLANLRLNPLRPLGTLFWGYIQDEHNRLTVARRAYEYDHEYGLRLMGRAVSEIQTVDSRSKFLEAFHNLLYITHRFYKEADDMTFKADAFPVLNALRELHLILAQGAHNQFGDLPWTARVEMLIQEWLLARPEIREFLGGAPMVPYKESWMAHADSMKTLQGWTDVTVSHYRDLGVFGEQILMSVRYEDWTNDDRTQDNAYQWAIYWRPEIQSYIHSYRAVTGIDLTTDSADPRQTAERYLQPSIHLARRLQAQLSGASQSGLPQGIRRGVRVAPMRMTAASRNGQAAYRRNGV